MPPTDAARPWPRRVFLGENVAAARPDRLRSAGLRAAWLPVVLLLLPLAAQVTLLRLLTYSMLRRSGRPDLGELLWSNAPLPVLVLVLALACMYAVHTAQPRLRPFWQLSAAAGLLVALMSVTAFAAPWWLTEWLSLDALAFVRDDLLLLLALGMALVLLLYNTRGRLRGAVLVAAHGLTLVLMLLSAVTFGYFNATGAPVDWHVLRYFAAHAADLAPLVRSEIGPGQGLLLALPLLVMALPTWIMRRPAVRRWSRPWAAAPRGAWQGLGHVLPAALLLWLLPSTTAFDDRGGSLASLVYDVAADALGGTAAPAGPRPDTGPLFDTQRLRLTTTDSSRALNVVFIILESVRSRSVTPYAPSLRTTPFLDSLAQHALVAEQLYTVVPHTNKSLTAIFGGIYPRLNRDISEAAPGGLPGTGLPTLLEPLGYQSAFFTPATLAYEDKRQLLRNLGFGAVHGDGDYPTDGFFKKDYFGYEDRIMLDASLEWLDAAVATGKPFFLSYLTLTAHHPYDTPPWFTQHTYPTPDEVLNQYYNALRYTDDLLRDLFAAFAARGLIDETLFIIAGDHGEAFGEHQLRTHGDVIWDEVLHVPTLLYNPTLFSKGRRITGLRQHIDFLPTVADALGLRLEDGHYPGHSLLAPPPPGRTLYHSAWNGDLALALRRDSLKFVYHHGRRPMQVFNITDDPLETDDLSGTLPPALLRSAQMELLFWRQGVEQHYARPEAAGE